MRIVIALAVVAACTHSSGGADAVGTIDLCAQMPPVVAGGTIELGQGISEGGVFEPITEAENLTLILGPQGFWMFIMNARTRDMSVGTDALRGAVTFALFDPDGVMMSDPNSCRVLEFTPLPDSYLGLRNGYALPFSARYNGVDGSGVPLLEGATVRIHLEVRDHDDHLAVDDRTVIAHMPPHALARTANQ